MKRTIFITGTDTSAGKTVLTALLAEFLRLQGVRVAALKPVCSGGRSDARLLHSALAGAMTLDEINPWHYRAPLSPALAARREKQRLRLAPVLDHIRSVASRFEVTLVEGAGGLLSPLGVNFDSRDLIRSLGAIPVIVAPNRLGVVNHLLLTMEALPAGTRAQTQVVLMMPPAPDSATASNPGLLKLLAVKQVQLLPWLGPAFRIGQAVQIPKIGRVLAGLVNVMESIPDLPKRKNAD